MTRKNSINKNITKKEVKKNTNKVKTEILPNIKTKNNIFIYLIIIVLGFIIYANTLKNNYVLDDCVVLTENVFTQKGIAGIKNIFKYDSFVGQWFNNDTLSSPEEVQNKYKIVAGGRYRPLSLVSFALEVEFFGKKMPNAYNTTTFIGNPIASHLINIILYILTTCLLFKILSTFFPLKIGQKWFLSLPFIATLLFLTHPIHVEAVANVKGRDEIMTLLGSLGALWFSMEFCKNKKIYNLLLSCFCLLFGLFSKENAITFVAVIPLSLYLFSKQKLKTILTTLIPLIIAAGIFLFVRGMVLGFSLPKSTSTEVMNNPFIYATLSEKYATIFYTLWIYIKLLIFPHPLTYDYYPAQIPIINFSNPKAFLPLILYLIIGFYGIYSLIKKKNKIISWSIWIYLIPLSIVSNLFFPIGTFMNDRFIFISSIGFCVVFAWLFCEIIPKYIKNIKLFQSVISVSLLIILGLYSIKTISRNSVWENEYILNTTDVKVSTNSAKCNRYAGEQILYKASQLRGDTIQHDKLCQQAIEYLEKSIKIYPGKTHTEAMLSLAAAYFESTNNCDINKTFKCYAKVLHIKSNRVYERASERIKEIAENISLILEEKKTISTPQEIVEACDEILKVEPDFGEVIYLKALMYAKFLNNLKIGITLFEEANAVEKFKKPISFYRDMGFAYYFAGEYAKALPNFLKEIETNTNDYRAYISVGVTYRELGDIENAEKYLLISKELEDKQK